MISGHTNTIRRPNIERIPSAEHGQDQCPERHRAFTVHQIPVILYISGFADRECYATVRTEKSEVT